MSVQGIYRPIKTRPINFNYSTISVLNLDAFWANKEGMGCWNPPHHSSFQSTTEGMWRLGNGDFILESISWAGWVFPRNAEFCSAAVEALPNSCLGISAPRPLPESLLSIANHCLAVAEQSQWFNSHISRQACIRFIKVGLPIPENFLTSRLRSLKLLHLC